MAKKCYPPGRKRISASYTVSPGLKIRLDEIDKKYKDRYLRLRSDVVDTAMEIAIGLVERYGPQWYYENKDVIVKAIFKRLQKD